MRTKRTETGVASNGSARWLSISTACAFQIPRTLMFIRYGAEVVLDAVDQVIGCQLRLEIVTSFFKKKKRAQDRV